MLSNLKKCLSESQSPSFSYASTSSPVCSPISARSPNTLRVRFSVEVDHIDIPALADDSIHGSAWALPGEDSTRQGSTKSKQEEEEEAAEEAEQQAAILAEMKKMEDREASKSSAACLGREVTLAKVPVQQSLLMRRRNQMQQRSQ
eukprot:CAMPEP_0178424240 /NCGR_PEP_ID=MMETSP0689_2-20121128/28107_1 /TAXON_ID=160604 /ORGANISM="Amphidinium massartii, Strain CS-259" /LENGTH=145 /DNA_ID=CAMNT_0020045869 /DNA_START=92 /DNA_END=529 /DNA_ORIENTATION=-